MCNYYEKMIYLCLVTVGLLTVSVSGRGELYERTAYFWHITDMHYDGHFNSYSDIRKGCWRPNYDGSSNTRGQRGPLSQYGDYSCDSTWELIESAAKMMMMTKHNENVEFVLWTGDALSRHAAKHQKEDRQLEMMQNVTDLLRKTFTSQFVFPALGHDDPLARKELGKMWSQWLPTDALRTFETGGYYIIERKTQKLQIVVLNTNLMKHPEDDEDAKKQWDWLERVLDKFKKNGETVYLVGHIPPGSDERHKGLSAPSHIMYKDNHNKRYLKIIRKYHSIIVGQFFGHLHSDTFRIMYSENGRPISWAMLAPSITPKRTHDGPNNPGLRIYKFDKDSGQVFDYTQYYLDLSTANNNGKADWVVEYNFSTYYGINDITPLNLHILADKFTQETSTEYSLFNKYYMVNSVRIHTKASTNCDETCAHTHYCAITRVDYDEHEQCLKIAASALSSSSPFLPCGARFKLFTVVILGLLVSNINTV